MSTETDKILREFTEKMYQLKIDHCVRMHRIEVWACVAKWSIFALILAFIAGPFLALVIK